MTAFDDLYTSIQSRPRPEDAAELVLDVLGTQLTTGQRTTLEQAARYSFKRMAHSYSSMASDFQRIVGADRIVQNTANLFKVPNPLSAAECVDPDAVERFFNELLPMIHAHKDGLNFRSSRLPRAERQKIDNFPAKRLYNRLFRALKRLEERVEKMVQNSKKYRATRLAKSAGATLVTKADLEKDLATACFIAYYSAKMNVRSMFSNTGQNPAYDNVAEMLLRNAMDGTPNWYAIALVHPEADILRRLTHEEQGRLLGIWTEELRVMADMLYELWRTNDLDLTNCVVHKGNDSTTWNAVAGAWNKARDSWMNLIHVMGMETLLDHFCPGKTLRLMASDVVQWQGYSKSPNFNWKNQASVDLALHPDTLVFRALPKPWEVFQGKMTCTRAQVKAVTDRVYNTNPAQALGWYGMKLAKRAASFQVTPELVHGVTVSSPYLASVLKSAGEPSTTSTYNHGVAEPEATT